MTRVLFLIHDLGHGGAEKVLVNLVNNMDHNAFDITVISLFGGGINEQFLDKKSVRYKSVFRKAFPGNSHIMKLLSPRQLHSLIVKDRYDIEVSYLEGPSARIISGCNMKNTKTVSWIHIEQCTRKKAARAFRSYEEAEKCYNSFQRLVSVSNDVKQDFLKLFNVNKQMDVLHNTNEANKIREYALEQVDKDCFRDNEIRLIGVGKIVENKGFDRLARIHYRLKQEGYPVHTYILGKGGMQEQIEKYLEEKGLIDSFTFLGYQLNPYKYIAKCDLFLCSSYSEGFSTAATEALIVGTPVCTVDVSGMKEMLGENNEYGVVTENNEDALYAGMKRLLDDPALLAHYRRKAQERGKTFSTENTVKAVEKMFWELVSKNESD